MHTSMEPWPLATVALPLFSFPMVATVAVTFSFHMVATACVLMISMVLHGYGGIVGTSQTLLGKRSLLRP